MKSFYEPLFDPCSIDFCMSYICLHWLDAADDGGSGGIRDWKRLHLVQNENAAKDCATTTETRRLGGFLQVNERTSPAALRALWKERLADRHLAHFLSLRALELRPGGELLLVMVSSPHEYWRPPRERSFESPLLIAMQRCVADGSLRREVLENTIVPYYLRQPADVLDALALAQREEEDKNAPIHFLEVVELKQYETPTGGNSSNNDNVRSGNDNDKANAGGMKGARNLFWAIHGGSVVNAGGATDAEVQSILDRLIESFDECYDPNKGIVRGNFIACVFRKKRTVVGVRSASKSAGRDR